MTDSASLPGASRSPGPSPARQTFSAVAFVENLSLKEIAGAFPGAKVTPHCSSA